MVFETEKLKAEFVVFKHLLLFRFIRGGPVFSSAFKGLIKMLNKKKKAYKIRPL